jgi:hypothetical protein
MNIQIVVSFVAKLLQRIRPQDVAHKSASGRLTEPVDLMEYD